VHRSALALKLLVSEPHGALVAAPTFGLPELIGGERNWDYRYTWIRDASFTLYALIRLGYTGEAAGFMRWIEARCNELAEGETLQTMYRLDGGTDLAEIELEHLEGYRGSRPVRIGNGAHRQLQLDIYGELMDSVYLYDKYGEAISYDLWLSVSRLVDWVCSNWQLPDEGIWEIRGPRQSYLYSRLLCWVALDRAVRLAVKRSFPAPLGRWIQVRDAIYRDIFTSFWSRERSSFVQRKGSDALDASCLLMPLVRFVSATDPRWLSTLAAVRRDLVSDALVHRYRHAEAPPDGMTGEEGTFSMCSFWYAECLSRAGDLEAARLVFEKMLGYANHLGLYAEEIGPQGEHLGNFPQAFTHLALISAAYNLDQRLNQRTIGTAPTEKT
jgi:GH15 family glucan-1,4-alpha-glucosidase